MKYLLDTCILSKLRKIKTTAFQEKNLIKWISSHKESSYFISALTIGEIQSGIWKLKSTDEYEKNFKSQLMTWLYEEVIPRFENRILPIDSEVSLVWGKLTGECRSKGIVLPAIDSLIAATAITHSLIIATDNLKDFKLAGIEAVNPCN